MDDLLKEAIADAKAVRETALENAKMALEEAFTPRLQSMLSKKIQTEMEDEDEYAEQEGDEEDVLAAQDEFPEEEVPAEEEPIAAQDEDPSDEFSQEDDMEEEGVIEINGVKYAPVVSEDDGMEDIPPNVEEQEDEEGDLDLEAVIKELEDELEESENPYDNNEQHDDMKKESNDVSSGIGTADNKEPAKNANDDNTEDPQGTKLTEEEGEEVEEDIDLDEVLKALSEEEDSEEEQNEVTQLRSDLDEHRSVIETLRGKLNEVNLLNAKLLFTNKLFRKYGLNNEQKMKVVEQFDRASTLREVKLVYSTLGESFGVARNNINESKGSASKPIASTKSEKKVISESTDLRDRFKKLANLI
jgi:hypothetical protein